MLLDQGSHLSNKLLGNIEMVWKFEPELKMAASLCIKLIFPTLPLVVLHTIL